MPTEKEQQADEREHSLRWIVAKAAPALVVLSGVISANAVAASVVGGAVAASVAGVAATSLAPVVLAAFERRQEAQSTRAARARALADAAWDKVIAAREG